MPGLSLILLLVFIAIAVVLFGRRKDLRAPGLRAAMLIIAALIVLFVIWVTWGK